MSFLWSSKGDKPKKLASKELKDNDGSDSEASTVASENDIPMTTCYGLVKDCTTKKPRKPSEEDKPSAKQAAQSESPEVANIKPQESNEIFIDGKLYDVTNFKHPGGRVIKFFQGSGDASAAFQQFHLRSKKAHKMIAGLPTRPAPAETVTKATSGKEELAKDFEKLTLDLKAEGYFDSFMPEVIFRCGEIVVMFALGFCMLWASWWTLGVVGIVFIGIAEGRCMALQHEAGHFSLTGNIKTDHILQNLFYGVGSGMSAGWWSSQHNRHHATPQKLNHDPDLDTLPLVLFNTAASAKGVPPMMKKWLQAQAYLFIPLTCMLVWLLWEFLVHPRYIWKTKRWGEVPTFAVRYCICGWVFSGWSWSATILCYCLIQQVAGAYIFTNTALSHSHTDVTESDEHIHWCEYASDHTINISNHWFVNWWMVYLNFQIEHHLFPSMPQFRHPAVSKRVRALFRKHGLRYETRGWFAAMGDVLKNLHEVGQSVEVKHKKQQ